MTAAAAAMRCRRWKRRCSCTSSRGTPGPPRSSPPPPPPRCPPSAARWRIGAPSAWSMRRLAAPYTAQSGATWCSPLPGRARVRTAAMLVVIVTVLLPVTLRALRRRISWHPTSWACSRIFGRYPYGAFTNCSRRTCRAAMRAPCRSLAASSRDSAMRESSSTPTPTPTLTLTLALTLNLTPTLRYMDGEYQLKVKSTPVPTPNPNPTLTLALTRTSTLTLTLILTLNPNLNLHPNFNPNLNPTLR
mmetsp:Transcript_1419/g.3668  ORF Transcript_1419/g.3668 Transcript_1419/m.3668 type:complete len:246 (+) Transcript_1419:1692-2429(+)